MKHTFRVLLLVSLCILTISGFSTKVHAQVGLNNLVCPHVPYSEGMLNLEITPGGIVPATFSAGMIGVFNDVGNAGGGLDWMTTQGASASGATLAPTNELGTQLITWWTQMDNRTTKIQVTNHGDGTGPHTTEGLEVHIRLYSSDCNEIRDFCDIYTPSDTHIYDLSNLVTNTGIDIGEVNLADKEGLLIITPVDDCHTASREEQAIDHNFLSGNVYISDTIRTVSGTPHGYAYGANMYARRAICNAPSCTGILDGSENARLDTVLPDSMYGLFNTNTSASGSDVVLLSFMDDYGPPYFPLPGFRSYSALIFDNNEIVQTCGDVTACFLRLGINSSFPARQDFTAP
ncbi:MAG: hypothetical protein AAF462_09540 [Thermodesulfobacteriota bacterium]